MIVDRNFLQSGFVTSYDQNGVHYLERFPNRIPNGRAP
jgi:hypothetical protein